jgi:hypothetical protein
MELNLNEIDWFAVIIFPIIVGIVLWLLPKFFDKPLENLRGKLKSWWFKIKNSFSQTKKIEDYFYISNGHNPTDLAVYQFGLRPNLPIPDILYLEVLKKMVKEKKIKKIAIFPTIDKSSLTQLKIDYTNFKNNIESVFCEHKNNIEFIDPFRKSELTSTELIDKDFIDTLNYLNSTSFYNEVLKVSGQRIKGIQDFNKFHPKEKGVMTIVTHIFKAWEVREYLLDFIKKSNNENMNIGFIFWKLEFDKWGIYSRTAKDEKINELTFLIGKTIYGRNNIFKKRKPIPVFVPNETIGVFDEKESIFEKIVRKHSKVHVSILIEIITAILKDNYQEDFTTVNDLLSDSQQKISSLNASNIPFGKIFSEVENNLSDNEKILFGLILKLRSKYGC